jgi:hypothetical protein
MSLVRIGCFSEQRDPKNGLALLGRGRYGLGIVIGGNDRHVTTTIGFLGELDRTMLERKQGMIATETDIDARMEGRPALTHEDIARQYALATKLLHAKAF